MKVFRSKNIGCTKDKDNTWEKDKFEYIVSSKMKNWLDSGERCRMWGGTLASISSATEFNHIKNIINEKDGLMENMYWFGANDSVTEGKWAWSDYEKFGFTAWDTNEPSSKSRYADCGVLSNTGYRRWKSASCKQNYRFICKRFSAAYKKKVQKEKCDQLKAGTLDASKNTDENLSEICKKLEETERDSA